MMKHDVFVPLAILLLVEPMLCCLMLADCVLSGASFAVGTWVACFLNWFCSPLNAPLQVLDLEAAAGPGLYVVVDLLSVCIASVWSSLGSRSGGCEACWLIPLHGVEDAFLLGLLIDDYGRVCKGTPADEMNFDIRFWSGIESRSKESGGMHYDSVVAVVGLQKLWIG
ncbi:hypothetical protein Nepgr_002587 [Nepenthes gracilis]|uniref:Secreted protein n=1 Tax=Nepenthes gracilis TaxID=150966 RepID=A0AAD3P787_NEPGR|nr:hypothetical protein Nepgr_002587 [Nepenthes gracilis]